MLNRIKPQWEGALLLTTFAILDALALGTISTAIVLWAPILTH